MTTVSRLDATFAALADPTRRAILARLAAGEAGVMELARPFAMSQPAISKHLKVLERAGLVSRGRRGQTRPCELNIRRTFNAPRELVFRAWTEPQLLAQWSCPRGYTFSENRGELRVGGTFSARMRSPEGTEHRLRGVYREIVPPERLVFTHCWVDEQGAPGPETLVTVTLAEHGGRTEMSFHQALFVSVEARDRHEQGWTNCFERLAELLGTPQCGAQRDTA